ncbi:MAG: hypothetical protein RLZZ127_1517 [Planctomycetota bacterium]|jgi:hypothetical protein
MSNHPSTCSICRQPVTDEDSLTVVDGRPSHIRCARMVIVVKPMPRQVKPCDAG